MAKRKFPKLNELLDGLDVHVLDKSELRSEQARLDAFEAGGGLERPVYALSPGMDGFDLSGILGAFQSFREGLDRLKDPSKSGTGYRPKNGFFDSPDADALYLMVRRFAPKRIIEVGCGNSTRVSRQALNDAGGEGLITAIDPYPRKDIEDVVDRFEQTRLESTDPAIFAALEAGDILFIDSSHQVRMSNDVAHLFCRIIPTLPSGVVIHVHDVFLPFEYPNRFFRDCPSWGEQYLLHALLQGGGYDILWPGHYLQRLRPDAMEALPFLAEGRAQSFWMIKK